MSTVWARLAEMEVLAPCAVEHIAQALGADTTASASEVGAFFDRPVLNTSTRNQLMATAPAKVCAHLLDSRHATLEDIETALNAHPDDTEVLAACAASPRAAGLIAAHLRSLSRTTLAEIARSIRYAQYDALATVILEAIVEDKPDREAIEAEWKASQDQREHLERSTLVSAVLEARTAWREDVHTALLAVNRVAWPELVGRLDPFGASICYTLLDHSDYLDDQTLRACLPHLLHHQRGWDDEVIDGWHVGVDMRFNALNRARKFPRYREFAGDEFRAVLDEAISLGGMPTPDESGHIEWDQVHAAAFFTQDPKLLEGLIPLAALPAPHFRSTYLNRDPWREDRARRDLVRTLLGNPSATDSVREAVLNSVAEEDLRVVARDEKTEPEVRFLIEHVLAERAAARAQADRARIEAAYPLLDDDELAANDNPEAALIHVIRTTRQAPTARRTEAIERVLASRHLTPKVAWHLPAAHLFRHEEHGPRLAVEIAELCGSSEERWQCLRDQANPTLSPNLSAHTLIERISKQPSGTSGPHN